MDEHSNVCSSSCLSSTHHNHNDASRHDPPPHSAIQEQEGDESSDDIEALLCGGNERSREEVLQMVLRHKARLLHLRLIDPLVHLEQALKDFQRERVLLNGLAFVPSRTHLYKNYSLVNTLPRLVAKLCAMHPNAFSSIPSTPSSSSSSSSSLMSDLILQRACRTGAGADSLFMVQRLLCVEGTFAKHCSNASRDPPILLDVFFDAAAQSICSRSQVSNTFAIHDTRNLEQLSGHESSDPLPWLLVETVVVDFTDFKTLGHDRRLELVVFVPYGRDFRQL